MGYQSTKIAEAKKEPAEVSLSGLPNFIKFEGYRDSAGDTLTSFTIEINEISLQKYYKENPAEDETTVKGTAFTIREAYNKDQTHTFAGTNKPALVDEKTYLLDKDAAVVAQNIRACLLKNSFFGNRFSIEIPFRIEGNTAQSGTVIQIVSLGAGELYNIGIEEGDIEDKSLITIAGTFAGRNGDMVDRGMGNVDIEIDVYSETELHLGEKDLPDTDITPSRFLVTMSKSYFGQPVWFDVNALTGTKKTYSDAFLQSGIRQPDGTLHYWKDAGTANGYRLIAKSYNGSKREVFYYSDILYTITGYARTLDQVDMTPYIYDDEPERQDGAEPPKFRPLTTQPVLPHTQGQSQYFNFIMKDRRRTQNLGSKEYTLGVYYDFFTTSGRSLGQRTSFLQSRKNFGVVNTVKLDLDEKIEEVENSTQNTGKKKVGYAKVYLCRNGYPVGDPLEFCIMPDCLHTVNDFAFLNSLGGWSSFNFEGEKSVTAKSDANTIYKTQLPDYTVSSQIESVFDKEIKETFSVKTAPVTAEVADWLKEMTASLAVYELSTRRYVVIDDFNVKHTTKDNLFVLEMKYHYSDTYNAVIK